MRKVFNQKGLTLVEVLAIIAIMSVLLIILSNIQLTCKEQYTMQTEKNNQLTDLSYTLKVITKDIRKSGKAPQISGNTHTIGSDIYRFNASTNTLTKNDAVLAHSITALTIEPITSKKYKISITSTNESIDTQIVIRSGG